MKNGSDNFVFYYFELRKNIENSFINFVLPKTQLVKLFQEWKLVTN